MHLRKSLSELMEQKDIDRYKTYFDFEGEKMGK